MGSPPAAHQPVSLPVGAPLYPEAALRYLGDDPPAITAIGNLDLLDSAPLALFCSVRCPGRLILQTYDLAQALRAAEG